MTEFTSHTYDTAPMASKPLIQKAEQKWGFIPNLLAVMAESPATLESYLTLGQLFDKTSFTVTERQLILLSISRYRNCCYCLAAHGTIAKSQNISTDLVNAVYYKQPFNDEKLDALRTFTLAALEHQGWVKQPELTDFYQAGYNKQHVLEVVLAISFKTLSNFINHINDTAIDNQFLVGMPDNKASSCCCESEV
jgi:uncharacterized peroxidase-related enzyme